ncbi:MAG: hypothetical protein RML46_02390 [Anaerolineae bacterium]|nr:hypothetical protein [Anaerolineae bacterium]MDW8067745.1 hypothetical protein [Anaerolineae bacterium]
MKRLDWRIIVGLLLIIWGALTLLERVGVIPWGVDLFWGLVSLSGGAAFLYLFFVHPRAQWWAAIPGFFLLGLSIARLLPGEWNGVIFLGSIGLAFWAIYLTNTYHWWAILNGGVLLTLAAVAGLSESVEDVDTGSIFFLGLGLTFLLVALLTRRSWAYVPAIALVLFAAVLGLGLGGLLDWLWIGVLFLAGLALVLAAMRSHRQGPASS